MSRLILSLLLVAVIVHCEVKEEEGVLVLTKDNFDEVINNNQHVLVEFYAPWCGHCKSLAPEYAKAAEQLAKEGSLVKLGKVDATENQELATKFGVSGYPTLKWFVNGAASEYKGGRVQSEIVNWIMKKTGPSVQMVDQDKFNQLKETEKVFYVQIGSEVHSNTEALAQELDDLVVVHIDSLEGFNKGDFVAFRKFDEPSVKCDSCSSLQELQAFVDNTRVAKVMEFDQDAAQFIFGGQKSSIILFVEAGSHQAEIAVLTEASEQIRAQGLIVSHSQIAKDIGQRLGEYLGIKAADLPKIAIVDFSLGEDMSKFYMDKAINVENILEFSTQWKNKDLKRTFKTAEVPAEPYEGNVRVLVGKNFVEEVYNEGQFTLVEFYAPWCGHCKKLVPEYEAVAKKLRGFKNLVIAKVDSTENEIEGISVQGFPTLKFFVGKEMQEFDGGRTADTIEEWLVKKVEGLQDFINSQATQEIKEEAIQQEEQEEQKADL